MVLIDEIVVKIAFVVIFAMIISWFCGIYFFLSNIAATAKRIAATLEEIAKRVKGDKND